jgi:hypothetical protein
VNFDLDSKSALWRYRLLDERTVAFDDRRPHRRWSFDDDTKNDLEAVRQPLGSRSDRLAPALPVFPKDEDARLQLHLYEKTICPQWESGRWLYSSKHGTHYVFHDQIPRPTRRKSFDVAHGLDEHRKLPHRARSSATISLGQKTTHEHTGEEKFKWYKEQIFGTSKRWYMKTRRRKSRSDAFSVSDSSDANSVLSSKCEQDNKLTGSNSHRRWSVDDAYLAFPGHVDTSRHLRYIGYRSEGKMKGARAFHAFSQNSTPCVRGNNLSSSSSDFTETTNERGLRLLRIILIPFSIMIALMNLVCCCGPCTLISMSLHRRQRRQTFGDLREHVSVADIRELDYHGQSSKYMQCKVCDAVLKKQDWTHASQSIINRHKMTVLSYVLNFRYTASCLSHLLGFLGRVVAAILGAKRQKQLRKKWHNWYHYELGVELDQDNVDENLTEVEVAKMANKRALSAVAKVFPT